MRSVLGFFSLIALGLLTAGLLAVGGTGPVSRLPLAVPHSEGFLVDYFSLALGVVVGLFLSVFARISWGDLPRRALAWLMANERNFRRFAWALFFLGVLFFY